jgi:hypothetical protein
MFIKLTQRDGKTLRPITIQTEHVVLMDALGSSGTCIILNGLSINVTEKMEDILMFMDLPEMDLRGVKMEIEKSLKNVTSKQYHLEHQKQTSVHDALSLNVLQGQRMAFEECLQVLMPIVKAKYKSDGTFHI